MRAGHVAGAAPLSILGGVFLPMPVELAATLPGAVEVGARVAFGALVVAFSTVNDWDHPRFRDRSHPGAAMVRWSARLLYALHTAADERRWADRAGYRLRMGEEHDPDDMHRGPSHCLEWCALVAGLVALLAAQAPPLAPLAWWWGLAVFVGLASHVVLDAMTPSGVPLSAVYNYLVYGEVWRRHAFAWRWRAVGTVRLPGPVARVRALPLVGEREVPGVGLVDRAVAVPFLVVIPVDTSHEGCRAGLFYTDGALEHLLVIPVMWAGTAVLAMGLTGTLLPALYAVTGWSFLLEGGA